MGIGKRLMSNAMALSFGLYLAQPVVNAQALDVPQPDNWPTITSQSSTQPLGLASGVSYQRQNLQTSAGPMQFSSVNVDLTSPTVGLQAVVAQDKILNFTGETVSSMANRTGAVAGINGDYFDINNTNAPLDIVESNGQLYESPIESADGYFAALAFDAQNHASIVRFTWEGQLLIPNSQDNLDAWSKAGGTNVQPSNQTEHITSFNSPIGSTGLSLYDQRAGSNIPAPPSGTHRVSILLQQVPGTDLYEVKSITENSEVPVANANQYQLVGQGPQADWLLNNVVIGEKIQPMLNTTPDWRAYKTIIAGGPVLVQDGQVQTQYLTSDQNIYPLTAVGLSADGKTMSMVVVDGRQNSVSAGLSRLQFAEYFKSLGFANVLDLDGGGSSEMVIRSPGDTSVTVANSPSDGVEREVANGLFVYNLAPTGALSQLIVDAPATKVFVGSQLKFRVKGVDTNLQPVPVDMNSLSYSTTVPGAEVTNGVFTAGNQAETGVIRVTQGNITTELPVEVVDKLGSLSVSPNPAVLTPGTTQVFTTVATDVSGDPVAFDNTQGQWSVQGDIGTIDNNGVLQVSSEPGSGTVTLTAGGASAVVNVNVGKPPQMIDDFEGSDPLSHWSSSAVRATGSISLSSAPDPVRHGEHSLALSYDFTNEPGTSAAYALVDAANGGRLIDGNPISVGMWVYGDGGDHWLRGVVVDGVGTKYPLNFTADQGLNWVGWKYVSAALPTSFVAPLKLTQIYVVEPHANNKNKGTVYFDDVRAVYYNMDEDLTGPTFSHISPAPQSTVYTARPRISDILTDDKSGVDASSIVMTVDGEVVKPNYDPDYGQMQYTPTYPLADGPHHVTIDAMDKAGNPAQPRADWTFTVLADTTPPVTTASTDLKANEAGWYNKDVTVTLAATDDRSGVASTEYSLDSGQTWNDFSTPFTITTEGTNTVTYRSKDVAGNQEQPKSLTINLDKTVPNIVYGGNLGTYQVDQNVDITCVASDALSGIASSTCQDITGQAYTFTVGDNTYSFTATDKAGNTATASISFNVVVTYDSLANLTNRLVTQQGVANSLVAKLDAAKDSNTLGDMKARDNQLNAFENEIAAQSGKAIRDQDAKVLTALAQDLAQQ